MSGRAIACVVFGLCLAFGRIAFAQDKAKPTASAGPLEDLAQIGLARGHKVTIRELFAKEFALPTGSDELWVLQISVALEGGKVKAEYDATNSADPTQRRAVLAAHEAKAIYVRRRDPNRVDIFLVTMPLGKTFWAEAFGMLTDKFCTHWMVNCEGARG